MSANSDDSLKPRDEQQARLVDSLRAAGGAPVGFDELREMGIERPAVLCYELEAAGLPITLMRAPDGRSTGARLDEPPPEEAAALANELQSRLPVVDVGAFTRRLSPRLGSAGRGAGEAISRAGALARGSSMWAAAAGTRVGGAARRAWRPVGSLKPALGDAAKLLAAGSATRVRAAGAWLAGRAQHAPGLRRVPRVGASTLASAAIVAALAGTAVLVIANPGWRGHPAARAHAQVGRPSGALAQRAAHRASPAPGRELQPVPPSTQGAPVKISPADAAALEAVGHQQLADGRYPQAIGSLVDAIKASGQSLTSCMEPTSEACLTFAYALYDLGRALRLDGNPSAAVPVLRERLRIDNQRPVVEQELQLARGGSA